MRTNLFILFLACACLNLQAQTRVVILTDFPRLTLSQEAWDLVKPQNDFAKRADWMLP